MIKHTPGPWVAGWNNGKTGPTTPVESPCVADQWKYTVVGYGTETVAIVVKQDGRRRGDFNANASLIAAAPELYDALMAYRGVKTCGHEFTCVCPDEMAAAALKKARGES
jgi:hypothetical protein